MVRPLPSADRLFRLSVLLLISGVVALAPERMALAAGQETSIHRTDSLRPVWTPEDRRLFREKYALAAAHGDPAARVMAVAQSFLGTPYVPGTLDRTGQEQLVVNLRALDCWTFVEQCVAIGMAVGGDGDVERRYLDALQRLRYQDGVIRGYASRIHYFSGWLLQAEAAGILENVTPRLGGVPWQKRIDFMSRHPDRYPQLSEDPGRTRKAEEQLSRRGWTYIPQREVAAMEHLIREGDIIAITSAKSGLDIAHEGFALRKNGRVHLLHASSLSKRVAVSSQPLAAYLLAQKGQTGIMVGRLK